MTRRLRIPYRWRRPLGLTAVVLAVLLVTVGMIAALTGDDRAPIGGGPGTTSPGITGSPDITGSPGIPSATALPPSTGGPAATSVPPAPGVSGTWRTMADAHLPAGGWTGVWTGSRLLVYTPYAGPGGTGVFATYQPADDTWRRLPLPPYEVQMVEGGVRAVWTGTEMLLFGMMSAAYNPATGGWRPLDAAAAGPSVTVWTGRNVLMWGGGCCGDNSASGSTYDPVTDRWQPMPAAPLAGRHTAGAWTGTELIIVGGQAEERVFADAAAYNPATGTWRSLPPLPAPRTGASVTWTGTEVLVVGGYAELWPRTTIYADGLTYDPVTNRWRGLPSSGLTRFDHQATWTGRRLLVWGGRTIRGDLQHDNSSVAPAHGVSYDPVTGRWSAMPTSPLRGRTGAVTAWTGRELLVWGGSAAAYPYQLLTDGAAYRPAGG